MKQIKAVQSEISLRRSLSLRLMKTHKPCPQFTVLEQRGLCAMGPAQTCKKFFDLCTQATCYLCFAIDGGDGGGLPAGDP